MLTTARELEETMKTRQEEVRKRQLDAMCIHNIQNLSITHDKPHGEQPITKLKTDKGTIQGSALVVQPLGAVYIANQLRKCYGLDAETAMINAESMIEKQLGVSCSAFSSNINHSLGITMEQFRVLYTMAAYRGEGELICCDKLLDPILAHLTAKDDMTDVMDFYKAIWN